MVADRNQKLYHDILTHPYNVQGTPTSFVPNLLVFLLTLFNLFMSGVISWDLVLVSDLQAASGQQPTIMVVVYLSTQGPNHLKFLPLGVGRFTWVKNPRSRHRTTVHVQILHRIPGPSGQCTWPATTEAAHGFVSKLQPNNLRFIKIFSMNMAILGQLLASKHLPLVTCHCRTFPSWKGSKFVSGPSG